MAIHDEEGAAKLTPEAMLVVELTKSLFAKNVDEAFRIIGRYLDKHNLKVSEDVFREFEIAGRIS